MIWIFALTFQGFVLAFGPEGLRQVVEHQRLGQYAESLIVIEQQATSETPTTAQMVKPFGEGLKPYFDFYRAIAFEKLNRVEAAEAQLREVIEKSDSDELSDQARLALSKILSKQSKWKEVDTHLKHLARRWRSRPERAEVLSLQLQSFAAQKKQRPFCQTWITAFRNFPQQNITENFKEYRCNADFDDWRARLRNLLWFDQTQRAQTEVEQASQLTTEEKVLLNVAMQLQLGHLDQVLELLEKNQSALRSYQGYTLQAMAFARLGKGKEAAASYRLASQFTKRQALVREARYQAAFMLYLYGHYDEARKGFQGLLGKGRNSAIRQDSLWHLAWIDYLTKDYAGAERQLRQILRSPVRSRNDRNPERLQYWLAMSLLQQRRWSEAQSFFNELKSASQSSYYALLASLRLKQMPSPLRLAGRPILSQVTLAMNHIANLQLMTPSDTMALDFVTEQERNIATLGLSVLEPSDSVAEPIEEGSEEPKATLQDQKDLFSAPEFNAAFERAAALQNAGLKDFSKWELFSIEQKTRRSEYLLQLMHRYEQIGQYHRSVALAHNTFMAARLSGGIAGKAELWRSAYPLAYAVEVESWSKKWQVEPHFVWSIMKAESAYKRDVVSPVGAIGLMQIMPLTGLRLAKLTDKKDFDPQTSLYEPAVSIQLGSRYLKRLLEFFGGSKALAAGGYNAGPHRMKAWLAQFGHLELDAFIEHVPFLETRNYIKRVYSHMWVYEQLYGKAQPERFAELTAALPIKYEWPVPTRESWDDIL